MGGRESALPGACMGLYEHVSPIASSTCLKASHCTQDGHSAASRGPLSPVCLPHLQASAHTTPCLLHSALGFPTHRCARPALQKPSSLLSLTPRQGILTSPRRKARNHDHHSASGVLPKATQPGRSTSLFGCMAGLQASVKVSAQGQTACSPVGRSHLQAGGELPEGRVHTRTNSIPFTGPST